MREAWELAYPCMKWLFTNNNRQLRLQSLEQSYDSEPPENEVEKRREAHKTTHSLSLFEDDKHTTSPGLGEYKVIKMNLPTLYSLSAYGWQILEGDGLTFECVFTRCAHASSSCTCSCTHAASGMRASCHAPALNSLCNTVLEWNSVEMVACLWCLLVLHFFTVHAHVLPFWCFPVWHTLFHCPIHSTLGVCVEFAPPLHC